MLSKTFAGAAIAATLAFGAAPCVAQSETENATAIFAGGCFWCIEQDFEKLDGVGDVVSGYTGGTTENPTYKQVTAGGTGHYEAVRVPYDPSVVSYGELVDYFYRHVDPTDAGGQFCDRGDSYRTAVFATPEQAAEAKAGTERASSALGQKVVTPVLDAATFYLAEDYHQDYADKNALRYKFYRASCGRDKRIDQVWSGASS